MNGNQESFVLALSGIANNAPTEVGVQKRSGRYRVIHRTEYEYYDAVNLCHNSSLLVPRNYTTPFSEQHCITTALQIAPYPDDEGQHIDFWGNNIHYFTIQQPHKFLVVTSTSLVERSFYPPSTDQLLLNTEAWEKVAGLLQHPKVAWGTSMYESVVEASAYRFPSALAGISDDVREYALQSFIPESPLLQAVQNLVQRIYEDCEFVSGFTTISTPITEVLRERKGVCQDFAHLALGCLRSMGLAARYVSGYIETTPPEGTERLIGVDASHAWIAVFVPQWGWVEFDPTNNQLVQEQYVALGWGRDYGDVPPLKGVIMSAAATKLSVSVDMMRLI